MSSPYTVRKMFFISDTSSNQKSDKSSEKSQNHARSWLIAYFCLQGDLNVLTLNNFLQRFKCVKMMRKAVCGKIVKEPVEEYYLRKK